MEAAQRLRDESMISLSCFEYPSNDICIGADPFIFQENGHWHLLVHENVNEDPYAHDGIAGYTVRSAATIETLVESAPVPLIVLGQPDNLRQVWAAEIHFGRYMYVAISDGNNHTHRMHIYETKGDMHGPWVYRGPLETPPHDERWAIDLTLAVIPYRNSDKMYAIWSGWEDPFSPPAAPQSSIEKIISQSLYIAEFITPFKIGPRHLLMNPHEAWCSSVAPILEGPQTLTLDGRFRGMVVTGNASWTDRYATNILKFSGGDPLSADSWKMHHTPLFQAGYGIGHGMIVEEGSSLYYVGHRKTRRVDGWRDRMVFYAELPREEFVSSLEA